MSRKVLCRVLCAAVLLSVSAFAVDGVVLINQATVNVHGFPYTITQSGSYRLTSNLVVPANTDGIDINADNVTLDLNGFSIVGPLVCTQNPNGPSVTCTGNTGEGVSSQHGGIAVRNGTVSGMNDSIVLLGKGNLVEEVRVSNNEHGINISYGVVRRCVAASNANTGIEADNGSVVNDNIATNNATGISVSSSTVTANTSYSNGGNGISAALSEVTGNTSNNNGGTGLAISDGIFGSNLLTANGTSLQNFGAISQNNNDCDGTSC